MNKYIDSLEENIYKSTKNIDDLVEILKNIKGNLISTGTGGSRIVAEFVSSVLAKKNHILTITVDPRDLNYLDKSFYDNLFISSYNGKNFGVKKSLDNDLHQYLLTNRITKIKK